MVQKTTTHGPDFDRLVKENVETIRKIESAAEEARTTGDAVADAIARFCGSTLFIWVHLVLIGGWLLVNVLLPRGERFDPQPFGALNLTVSIEAIFLSTFILISQTRQQRLGERRNHLDLQINLLAEQEASQMLRMMQQVMDHLGVKMETGQVEALQQATDPERMIEQIEQSMLPDTDTT